MKSQPPPHHQIGEVERPLFTLLGKKISFWKKGEGAKISYFGKYKHIQYIFMEKERRANVFLDLQQDFDTFQRGHHSLGDGRGNTLTSSHI